MGQSWWETVSDITAWGSLAIAVGLDYLVGDPWSWLHPVQVIGWGIDRYTKLSLSLFDQPLVLRLAGIGLTVLTLTLTGITTWLMVTVGSWLHPWLGQAIAIVVIASCLAGRSLRNAAEEVLSALETGDLSIAQQRLSLYVGRDTDNLSEAEILRAVLETVTENATDGVMAPLFYAILGSFFMGAAPLALTYKAASTLDSMVGYRTAPYQDLGWCSARLEDVLTWFPCRLTVLTIALLSGKPRQVLAICRRDAPQDPSPNAGWSECVYAASLGVQVGGKNIYQGVVKEKPLLGNSDRPITPEIIRRAMTLTRWNIFLWLAIALLLKLTYPL